MDEITGQTPATGEPADGPQFELLVKRALDLVDAARPVPLSTSSMINKDEVLEVLEEAIRRVPDELKAARWLLKEREEFLAKVRREGDDILGAARDQAAQMVERTEVVKSADLRARQILDAAETEARKMRLEVEDYCDQKLGSFEAVLDKTRSQVQEGRAKLQRTALDDAQAQQPAEALPDPNVDAGGFFDQDHR